MENKESFPQYEATWHNWLSDRQQEIELYKTLQASGDLEKMEHRNKEEVQAELRSLFGFADTRGFRNALLTDIETAEKWLNHIVENKLTAVLKSQVFEKIGEIIGEIKKWAEVLG